MGIDDGKKCLKVCLTNVDKGEVAMVKKRGKEVPENNDRGVKHCQVRHLEQKGLFLRKPT